MERQLTDLTRLAELFASDRFDAALRFGLQMPALTPALVHFQQGIRALKARDSYNAVLAFQALQQIDPDFPGLSACLVTALRRDALFEEALEITGPSRQLAYEQLLALNALSRGAQALEVADKIHARDPGHAATCFAAHAPALEVLGLDAALDWLRRAVAIPGSNGKYRAYLDAYGLIAGTTQNTIALDHHRAIFDGVQAILPHARTAKLFGLSGSVLRFAMGAATTSGMVLEFGVRRGTSIRVLADCTDQDIYGFDSFEGLPEGWQPAAAGALTTGNQLPPVPDHVSLIKGWFQDSLPPFLAENSGPVRLVNLDSDLYESAHYVLTQLEGRMQPGTILVFDELIGNRSWAEDEYKAFSQFIAHTGWGFELIALSLATKQAAFRLVAQN